MIVVLGGEFEYAGEEEYELAMLAARDAFAHLLMDMGESERVAWEKAECMVEMLDEERMIQEGIWNN